MKAREKNVVYRKYVAMSLSLLLIMSFLSLTGCSKKPATVKNEKVETGKTDTEQTPIKDNENVKEEDSKEVVEEKDNLPPEKSKMQYTKHQIDKSTNPEFATKWIDSENKKFSACIEGRGPDAEEEGIGRIFIKDLSTGEKWALEVMAGEEQNTPKYIQWIDDENIMNIVGLGYGTVVLGGSLYKTNVITGETTVLYEAKTPKEQVISANKVNSSIELQLLIYDDEDFTKNHTESKTIGLK